MTRTRTAVHSVVRGIALALTLAAGSAAAADRETATASDSVYVMPSIRMEIANNPLRAGRASICFVLPREDRVEIRVFDVTGRLVQEIRPGQLAAGKHEVQWDGRDRNGGALRWGAYFVKIRLGSNNLERGQRLIVLK